MEEIQSRTYRGQKTVLAEDDIVARAEEKEGTSAIRALRFTLLQAFVSNKSGLLVASNTRDLDALQGAARKLAVNLRRGDDLREDGGLDLEELQEAVIPFKSVQVHEQSTRRIRDVGDVEVLLDTAGETLEGKLRACTQRMYRDIRT